MHVAPATGPARKPSRAERRRRDSPPTHSQVTKLGDNQMMVFNVQLLII